MHIDDTTRLRHMLDATRDALQFTANKKRADLDRDRQLALAVLKCLEIIGEAAWQVSAQGKDRLPEIPWPDVIGMRHHLVHAYFDINLDIVWKTVRDDLPQLLEALQHAGQKP